MNKIDLKDTTFLIYIKIDSIIRLENLLLVIDFLVDNFNAEIIVFEYAKYCNNLLIRLLRKEVTYTFIKEYDDVFYRTKYINNSLKFISSKYVCIWDSDILIHKNQVKESHFLLDQNNFDLIYPYDGRFFDTSKILRDYFLENKSYDFLVKNINKMQLLYQTSDNIGAVGGVFFFRLDKFISIGAMNEQFYGWGLEDGELYYRSLRFNLRVGRVKGPLFHLTHPRDANGRFRSDFYQKKAYNNLLREIESL